jgi:hypothetical protein
VWRIIVFVLAGTGSITLSVIDNYVAAWVLGIPQVLFAFSVIVVKEWALSGDLHVRRWMLYASLIIACMMWDLWYPYELSQSFVYAIMEGEYWYGVVPSVTGLVTPVVLFLLWLRGNKPIINSGSIDKFFETRPGRLALFARAWRIWKKGHLWPRYVVLAIFLAINATLSNWLPSVIYLGLTFTYFGLHTLHLLFWKIVGPRRTSKGRLTAWKTPWALLAIIAALSDVFWWFTNAGYYIGAPVLFPSLLMFVCEHELWKSVKNWIRECIQGRYLRTLNRVSNDPEP